MNSMLAPATHQPSEAAQKRMLAVKGEPALYSDWLQAVFIHYEVDAAALQREVPFELDLDHGKAYISLVAFTMRDMRPRIGGPLSAFLMKPIATHGFLNVRAYVRNQGEPGIYFLTEYLPNPLSVCLGKPMFGLPYRHGKLNYQHDHKKGQLRGSVVASDGSGKLEYVASIDPDTSFHPCDAGSREEFLMERYTAFTAPSATSPRRFFRIWHPPWPQTRIHVEMLDTSLLTKNWPWFKNARFLGANYSPGFQDVWMGRPHRLRR